MDVEAFLGDLKCDPKYAGQIVHMHTMPSREPEWGMAPEGLSVDVRNFISSLGVARLYRHQAEGIEAALHGEDILLTTGTASGKSLCYQASILQHLLSDPDATALFVFPTKALARDQVGSWNRGLEALIGAANIRALMAMPFDADVDSGARHLARESARVLVTNPEMLHVRLLADHVSWGRFLSLFLTSDANDFDWSLGCRNASPNAMFWYEFYLRGIGHAEQCFELMRKPDSRRFAEAGIRCLARCGSDCERRPRRWLRERRKRNLKPKMTK